MDRTPELKFVGEVGEELAVWEWPGEDPPFLLAHATGFHGRCWDRIIAMFPERHCLALDARGHGRSSQPKLPYHWRIFGHDMTAVAEHWDVRDAIGIGHSSGGHTTVQAAALRPHTYRALLLVDPTIFPLEYYGMEAPDASFTLRRRNTWASPDEMFERFRARLPFANWRPEILRDYCDYGVLPRDGEFVLACPPALEASIYLNSKEPASNIYAEVAQVRHPVVVMRADRERRPGIFDLAASPTAPDLASRFAHGREVVLPGASHYIAMEEPEMVADEIRKLAGVRFGVIAP
ncbi:MAG: alpha/beta hydrolase [Candidatus Solibacter sp.]|nr:alpha/beta hydrolase [Candidatus Solibacter sp.]